MKMSDKCSQVPKFTCAEKDQDVRVLAVTSSRSIYFDLAQTPLQVLILTVFYPSDVLKYLSEASQ